VLREREIDLRSSTIRKCHELGDEYECNSEFLLMKMKLLNSGVVVKEESGTRGHWNGGGGENRNVEGDAGGDGDIPMLIGGDVGTSSGDGGGASGGNGVFGQDQGGGDGAIGDGLILTDTDVTFEPMETR
jgi:hypothetical protein